MDTLNFLMLFLSSIPFSLAYVCHLTSHPCPSSLSPIQVGLEYSSLPYRHLDVLYLIQTCDYSIVNARRLVSLDHSRPRWGL